MADTQIQRFNPVLRYDDGQFTADQVERVRTKHADVPPSQLG